MIVTTTRTALLLMTMMTTLLNGSPARVAGTSGPAGPTRVDYTLAMPEPSNHIFVATVTIDGLPADEGHLDLVLPAWRPGRYVILDLAGGVLDFAAADKGGKPLPWTKTDKSTWRVTTNGTSRVTATYRVYADEFQLRTRGLDDTHAFVDPSTVFMYSEKYRALPVKLKVDAYRGWRVTTGLEGKGTTFTAPDYDYFVDCALEIGTQKDHEFTVKGVPHVLSVYGDPAFDADSVTKDIAKIVTAMSDLWGDIPYDRYVFLLHVAPWAGGGTEHINSTIIGTRAENLVPGEGYRGFLGLVGHEYFHTWNVKRLRPKGIVPYDYTKENYTRELWISEGTTSYYDDLTLVRAGFTTADRYLNSLASAIRDDRMRPGNSVQSLSEASFDAWIKFGKGGAHSYNSETDFYGKGAHVSLLLDLAIREKTGNAKSLDDVMRLMYRRFPLGGAGYTVDDFQAAASEVAGADLSAFFRDYVHGTEPLPWETSLLSAGLRLAPADSAPKPWLGLQTRETGDRVFVARVSDNGPARACGLDGGDEIVAVDGRKATAREIDRTVAAKKKGDAVTLTVFRDNALREFRVEIATPPVPDYRLEKVKEPTPAQTAVFESWLSTEWE
jgi:predicted metalloprotease with PDZ domain